MDAETRQILAMQEKRIARLEKAVGIKDVPKSVATKSAQVAKKTPSKPSVVSNISFTQVLTVLGVLGIIIGAISFFFYAVANRWIGEVGQVLIGMISGLALAFAAYYLRKKNPNWSYVVFGGAYALEYISIGVGVLAYGVMPESIGILFCALLCISALGLSYIYESRAIAYFAVILGYLMPFITGTFSYHIFSASLYVILSAMLAVLSIKFRWVDLRLISFIIVAIFFSVFVALPISLQIKLTFLILVFALYHLASLLNIAREDSPVDSFLLIISAVIFFILLYVVLRWSITAYGLLILVCALAQLGEVALIKQRIGKYATLPLLSVGVVLINLGLFFFLNELSWRYFVVLFGVEQVLFAYLSKTTSEQLYEFASYIFLVLFGSWVVAIMQNPSRSSSEMTLIMILLFAFVIGFFLQYKYQIQEKVASVFGVGFGFIFLYMFCRYLDFFMDRKVTQILLSVLWLAYTLTLYSQMESKNGKVYIGALLGITLLKIAFVDLLFLSGVYRIIGFIVFGILLLVGGYFIRK